MPKAAAPHFTPAALTFLRQLRANNRREWFQPRKAQFDELLRMPLLALCEQVSDDLRSFAVEHVTPAAKAARRIYRNVRFSKDKTPYKTTISALFPRVGLGLDSGAVFYFGLSPEELQIAVGLYMPGPPELAAVRAAIAANPVAFEKLVTTKPLARMMGPCQGEQLVKVPKGFVADHPAADHLRRKQWYVSVALPTDAALKPTLRKAIVDRFKVATPFANYLNETVLAAVHDDTGDGRPVRPKPMF